VVHAAQKDFTNAVELSDTYQNLSFGDATTAAYMKREEIEYLYSFDDDFDGLDWVNRLETADNPYS
jgi:predicted nucleic acid-binding protein